MVPELLDGNIVVSNEVYMLRWKKNDHLSFDDRHAIIPLLRDPAVCEPLILTGTGSSSSRSRITDKAVESLPIPKAYFERKDLSEVASHVRDAANGYWSAMTRMGEVIGES